MKRFFQIFFSVIFFFFTNPILFSQIIEAPANVAAALLIKLSAFEKTVASQGEVVVYVLGSPKVATELEKVMGQPIGQSRLGRVLSGNDLPQEKPSILYVGDPSKLIQAIGYSKANKILSATGIPDLVKQGVTLGMGVGNDGKPKVLLNLASTVEENCVWNPAIMKVARIIK